MEKSKSLAEIGENRRGRLNMFDKRIDGLCVHLTEVTSSINSKVGRILRFEPRACEDGQATECETEKYSTFSESIEEKIKRLEAVANELDYINNHLENIIS